MKKNNVIVYLVALAISAYLLWLWYHHGLDHVDAPLDLVLSIVWWCLIGLAMFAIHRVEKKRQLRRRTCYVASDHVFNLESGVAAASTPAEAVSSIHDILRDMDYDMKLEDVPEDANGNRLQYLYVVRSEKFEIKQKGDERAGRPEKLEWEGEVDVAARPKDRPIPFQSREELEGILSRLATPVAA